MQSGGAKAQRTAVRLTTNRAEVAPEDERPAGTL